MNQNKIWQGNWTFILAAAGSAVGLGIFGNFHTWLELTVAALLSLFTSYVFY